MATAVPPVTPVTPFLPISPSSATESVPLQDLEQLRVVLREELKRGLKEHFAKIDYRSASTLDLKFPATPTARCSAPQMQHVASVDSSENAFEPHEWMTRHVKTFAVSALKRGWQEIRETTSSKRNSRQASVAAMRSKPSDALRPEVKFSMEEQPETSPKSVLPGQPEQDQPPEKEGESFITRNTTVAANKGNLALEVMPVRELPEEIQQNTSCHGRISRVIYNSWFEGASMLLICANALQVGLQTDYMARTFSLEDSQEHRVVELVFYALFTLEVVARFYVLRWSFFRMTGWAWNAFDLLLVILQTVEEVLLVVFRNAANDVIVSSFLLRTARLLRAVRVLRILKMALTIEDLRLFVSCIVASGKSFFASLFLLFLLCYVASVYLTQMIAVQRAESDWTADVDQKLTRYFGSVSASFLSVFEGLTGGLDWDVLIAPLLNHVSVAVGVIFLAFQAFCILAVTNVVSAMFIEHALRRAEAAKTQMHIHRAHRLFKSLDFDQSGFISFEEINDHLQSSAVQEFFEELNVHPSEAKFLFQMLDINNSGTIDFEEFVNGCIRLQGNAKALDLLLVTQETRAAFDHQMKSMQELAIGVRTLLEHVMGDSQS